jgi:arabinofuranosyltransferase
MSVTGETSTTDNSRKILNLVRTIGVIAVVIAVFRLAWISDDALISLRTALNISHGWGPGYNATEAVQAYTHPLWFLMWVSIGSLTNQWILGILFLSIVFTAVGTGLVLWRAPSIARVILITGILLFSNAFIEYATSGLENSLAYAAVAAVGVLALTFGNRESWSWGMWFGLASAAVFLTRFDLILMIAPFIAVILWHSRRNVATLIAMAAAFFAPLIVWFSWTQLTYATWLPNTFEAKRNVDIPATELVIQGFRYLMVSFEHDPVTLIGLVIGIGAALVMGSVTIRAGAVGVLIYLAYVVWIGGDFMAGRFLAVPLLLAMLLLAAIPLMQRERSAEATGASVITIAVLVVLATAAGSTPVSLANPKTPRWEVDQNFNAGVSDERGSYVALGRDLKSQIDTLSLAFVDPAIVGFGDGTGLNRPLRNLDRTAKEWPVNDGVFTLPSETHVMCGFMGTVGIVTGPTTHLIDSCALTDRFLAGRPFTPAEPFAWKPGHFHREIPAGYPEAVAANDLSLINDFELRFELQELWEKIR